MLKRIKRLMELSKKDPAALKRLEGLSDEQVATIPEAGDGKAVFISQGTEEEYREYEKEKRGLKGIFGL